ncbi:transposon TX1 [Tanacetum coccineum]
MWNGRRPVGANIMGGKDFGFSQLPANGNSEGIMLIWDTRIFTWKEAMGDKRFIAVKGEWKGINGEDTRIFTCKEAMGDERFIAVKGEWKGINGEVFLDGWCLVHFGDLNVVRCNDDRLNSQVNVKEMREFNDFINDSQLVEIPMGGRKFTRVSDDGLKFSKLDRFLLNEEFNCLWGNLSVVALDRKLSDHCPIVLKDVDLDFGPKPFRAFDIWLEESDFILIESLKKWSKERFGGSREKIKMYKKEAMRWELEAENRTLAKNERLAWLEARKRWEEKENKCNNMLHKKARIKWDFEGDENSKFFHSYIRRRNSKSNIRGLMVDGVWCEDPMKIKMEMARHYKALFTDGKKVRPIFCCERIEKITEEGVRDLEKDFNENEVLEAIRGCGGDKAPGPMVSILSSLGKYGML